MGKKILAVDDCQSVRQMVRFSLEANGHRVVECADAAAGLRLAKAEAFDLMVVDKHMPGGMDGIDMIRQIRSLPQYAATPILVFTTDTSEETKIESRDAGANGWLTKPCTPEILVEAVNRLL